MTSIIKKYMEDWQAKDRLLLNYSGGNTKALQNREYLKLKYRETRALLRTLRGQGLSKEDRIWLTVLKSGNKHLEKQLYPSRISRYTRRAVNFIRDTAKIKRVREQTDVFQNFPGTDFPKAAPNMKEYKNAGNTIQPLQRIPSANKYAAAENLKASKAVSFKR